MSVEKIKDLTKKDFDNCVLKINTINNKIGNMMKQLSNLKNDKNRLEPSEENVVLDAFIQCDFDCLNPKFVKKNIVLGEMIYFINLDKDGYYSRTKNIFPIFKIVDKNLIKITKFFENVFDSSGELIIINKDNYKIFIELLINFELDLDTEVSKIIEEVYKLLNNNPLSIIDESKIISEDRNGARFKSIILGKDKERFKIKIRAESYVTQSYIKIEKYSFEKSEWNYYHHLNNGDFPIMESIPYRDNFEQNCFDRIITSCINYILAFERYDINNDKN